MNVQEDNWRLGRNFKHYPAYFQSVPKKSSVREAKSFKCLAQIQKGVRKEKRLTYKDPSLVSLSKQSQEVVKLSLASSDALQENKTLASASELP